MTVIVDQELCEGCGDCLGVCPNDAIRISEGKALIEHGKCTCCQLCIEVCPTGAMQLSKAITPVILEKSRDLEVLQPQPEMMSYSKPTGWGGTALSFVGQYVLPRITDILTLWMEHRAAPLAQKNDPLIKNSGYNRPYKRCRNRYGRRFKKIL